MDKGKRKGILGSSVNIGAGQFGAAMSNPYASASDSMREGMDLFRNIAKKLAKADPEKAQGNLFEYIEAAKYNADAAYKGISAHALVTAAEGRPHDRVDIEIRDGEKILQQIQAKSSKSIPRQTYALSDPKYGKLDKLVNKGQEKRVSELANKRAQMGPYNRENYLDTASSVRDRISCEGASSGGTTYDEAIFAAKHPRLYSHFRETIQISKECRVAGAQAAKAGAVVGGAISVVKNCIEVYSGEKELGSAATDVIIDASRGGVKGYVTGTGGALIRNAARKIDLRLLKKSNVATAVAAGLVETGVTLYRYAKGELTAEETMKEIGQTGFSSISGIYTGAAAGLVFGPAGAVIGSFVGFIIASNAYQSSIAILQNAKLAEEEAARVEVICEEACAMIIQHREEFEKCLQEALELRHGQFNRCFKAIDSSCGHPGKTVEELSKLAILFGKELKMARFEDFDQFMKTSRKPLRI